MAATWVNVRYVGTTPISVNFKTWYPQEIHALPEGQLDEFKRIHGDVLVVLGPNRGDVPDEGPADQTWPYGPMTDAPMVFQPTPGDELTAVNVTLTNDAPVPDAVVEAQEALANPLPPPPAAAPMPVSAPRPQAPVITDEKRQELASNAEATANQMAERFVVATTGEALKGAPVESAVPAEGTPPVKGEPRTGHEVEVVEDGEQAARPAAAKGKGSK